MLPFPSPLTTRGLLRRRTVLRVPYVPYDASGPHFVVARLAVSIVQHGVAVSLMAVVSQAINLGVLAVSVAIGRLIALLARTSAALIQHCLRTGGTRHASPHYREAHIAPRPSVQGSGVVIPSYAQTMTVLSVQDEDSLAVRPTKPSY